MEPNTREAQEKRWNEIQPMEQKGQEERRECEEVRLRRWLISFASGQGWYPVGEYVSLDAARAIERAIEIFGEAPDYRAEEIPWDAAPLHRPDASFRPRDTSQGT